MPNKPAYPEILTNANWQKKKGVFAKLAGETGLGAALEACNKAYTNLDNAKFSIKQAYDDLTELAADWETAKSEGAKFETAVRPLLNKARDVAKSTAATYQKSKTIPKSAGEHCLAIAKACESFPLEFKEFSHTVLNEVENVKKKHANTLKVMSEALKGAIPKVRAAIVEVRKDPTPPTFLNKGWQPVRGLAANVAKTSFLKGLQEEWKTLSTLGPDKVGKEKTAILNHFLKVEDLVNRTEVLIPKG